MFIIILIICSLNLVENKNRSSNHKYSHARFYIYLLSYLYQSKFFGTALHYCLVAFYLSLKDSLYHFSYGESTNNKLLHLYFLLEYLNFSFIFEEQFCQTQNSWLRTIFSQHFKYIIPLPSFFYDFKIKVVIFSLRIPCTYESFFSCYFQDIFIFDSQHFDYNVPQYGSLCAYPTGVY